MTSTTCPTPAELAAFCHGDLPDDQVDPIADHLENCPDCEAAARVIESAPDGWLDVLRGAPTLAHPVSPLVAGPRRVGAYELRGELGRGGMGVVYEARHDGLSRPVALKMLLGGGAASPEQRLRFRAEAEAASRLQHPGIVQVFDVGEYADGQETHLYLAMEHVAGGSLSDRLDGQPLVPAQAARWVAALADAVQAAHAAGVTHRDIKPSNVLLTSGGEPKLGDFGIAKLTDDRDTPLAHTRTGAVLGTPSYMAPEQVDGQTASPASDQYALGAVLYECLTGRPPFRGADAIDTLFQVRNLDPVPVRALVTGVPRDLETVCLKCLEKEPRRRYGSASALADDLRRFLDGLPVVARPVGPTGRALRWSRRNPVLAVALLVATVSLSGGFLASWYSARVARGAEQTAKVRAAELSVETKRAETAEREAKSALQFLGHRVFAAARPKGYRGGLGRNVTLRDAVDAAETSVASEFAGQPRVESAVRSELGRVYFDLGLFDRAAAQLRRALACSEQADGVDNPNSLNMRVNLAVALRRAEPGTVEAFAAETLRRCRATLGDESVTTLTAFNVAVGTMVDAGKMKEGVKLARESLELCRLHLGPDHEITRGVLNSAAIATAGVQDWGSAIALYDQLKLDEEDDGRNDSPLTLALLSNLAVAYRMAGRPDDGLRVERNCWARQKALLGENHRDTVMTQDNLADSLRAAGQHAESRILLEDLLKRMRPTTGPVGPVALRVWLRLGRCLLVLRDYEAAETAMRECVAACGPSVLYAADGQSLLGEALMERGNLAEAEPLLRSGYTTMANAWGRIREVERYRVREAGERMVRLFERQGKPDEAAKWRTLTSGPDGPKVPDEGRAGE